MGQVVPAAWIAELCEVGTPDAALQGAPDTDVDKAKGHEPSLTLQQFDNLCLTFEHGRLVVGSITGAMRPHGSGHRGRSAADRAQA